MKTKSKKQENKWAKSMKGKAIPGSGNQDCWKGDVDSGRSELEDDWKLECKTTKNGYFKLALKDLIKVEQQADKVGRNPAFIIKFNDNDVLLENEFVVIPESLFNQKKFPFMKEDHIIDPEGKSVKLKKDELEDLWLNDKRIYVIFIIMDSPIPIKRRYVILNELDFKKMAGVI